MSDQPCASIRPLKCIKCGGLIVGKDADAGYHVSHADEHLRGHLTDGRWHDDCHFCYTRRVKGGTGVPA